LYLYLHFLIVVNDKFRTAKVKSFSRFLLVEAEVVEAEVEAIGVEAEAVDE